MNQRLDPERIGWLDTLIRDYRRLREAIDSGADRFALCDDDPEATEEMLREVRALHDQLTGSVYDADGERWDADADAPLSLTEAIAAYDDDSIPY